MGQILGCIQVDQSNVAIREIFGKFDNVLEPGCHLMPWCIGFQLAGYLSLRVSQLDVQCETKTKDKVFVTVVASIQYRALAEKAANAFYKLTNTKEQSRPTCLMVGEQNNVVYDIIPKTMLQAKLAINGSLFPISVIRASVPKLDLDSVFEQKNEIAKSVENELEKAILPDTLIVDIEPDERVKKSMNEINAASRLREAASEKAEAEKILQIKRAEGEAESKYLAGLGVARQRQDIVDGLRDSMMGFSANVPGTSSKAVMDMILVTQYFDTMKEIGAQSNSSSIFIPHGPGAVRDVSQIRDGLLQGQSAHHE